MCKKRIARPTVGAAERANMNKRLETTSSIQNDNMIQPRKQGRIEALLHKGEENALRTSFLSAITGLSPREMQAEIAREREAGVLILSTCRGEGGYFLPADGEQGQKEIDRFIRTLRARAINTLKALKTAQEALQNLPGQVCMDDFEVEGGEAK